MKKLKMKLWERLFLLLIEFIILFSPDDKENKEEEKKMETPTTPKQEETSSSGGWEPTPPPKHDLQTRLRIYFEAFITIAACVSIVLGGLAFVYWLGICPECKWW